MKDGKYCSEIARQLHEATQEMAHLFDQKMVKREWEDLTDKKRGLLTAAVHKVVLHHITKAEEETDKAEETIKKLKGALDANA